MADAEITQRETLLDLPQMQAALSEYVFDGAQFSSCRLMHYRYKPGKAWIACYALSFPGAANEAIVYVRAGEPSGSAARFAKSMALGQGVRHIPQLNSVAWIFPSDRKLEGLETLVDSKKLRTEYLPVIARSAFGSQVTVKSCSQEIAHYVPERSCVLRVNAVLDRGGQELTGAFYGKSYADEQGSNTYRYLTELWEAGSRLGRRQFTARPLRYDSGSSILWQLGLNGEGLKVHDPEHLEKAAIALAELHHSRVSDLPQYSPAVQRLSKACDVISTAAPGDSMLMMSLIKRLRENAETLSHRRPVTLHGDLHLKNFLVTGDGVALIDLDTLALGDSIEDLASFAAALYTTSLAGKTSLPRTHQQVRQFIEAYARASQTDIPEFDLNWHIAAALVSERAVRAVTRRKPDSPSPSTLIDLAAQFALRAESKRMEVAV